MIYNKFFAILFAGYSLAVAFLCLAGWWYLERQSRKRMQELNRQYFKFKNQK